MGEALIARRGGGIDTSDADATEWDILNGKTGYVNSVKLTGKLINRIKNRVNSFNITGTYATASYIDTTHSGYAITPDGNVIIFIKTTNLGYEHVCFYSDSLPSGITIQDNAITTFDTSDPLYTHMCMITGINSTIGLLNISVNIGTINSTNDFIEASITVSYVSATPTYLIDKVNSFAIVTDYTAFFDKVLSGYAITNNNDILLYIKTTSTNNEHVNFNAVNIPVGSSLYESITNYDTNDPVHFHACILSGITTNVNISINIPNTNDTYDYLIANVTVTEV